MTPDLSLVCHHRGKPPRFLATGLALAGAVVGYLSGFASPFPGEPYAIGAKFGLLGYRDGALAAGGGFDTTSHGRIYRSAARLGIERFMEDPTAQSTAQLDLGLAYGIRHATRGSRTAYGARWTAIWGWNYQIEPTEDGNRQPNPTDLEAIAAHHAEDPSKPVQGTFIHPDSVGAWFPSTGRLLDLAALQTYYPSGLRGRFLDTTYKPSYAIDYLRRLREGSRGAFWNYGNVYPLGLDEFPDDAALRATAFYGPVHGGSGVIWWHIAAPPGHAADDYTEQNGPGIDHPGIAHLGYIPTTLYPGLQQTHRFLQSIVAPVVNASEYLGAFHSDRAPHPSCFHDLIDGNPCADTTGQLEPLVFNRCHVPEDRVQYVDPSTPLLDTLMGCWPMVGLFRTDSTLGQEVYHLLIANRGLNPTGPDTIALKGGGWRVGVAESPIGYFGSTAYAPVATNIDGSGMRFSVALAGGEARMYRVESTLRPSSLAALTGPAPGSALQVGTTNGLSWSPALTECSVRLYVANDHGDPFSGPFVELMGNSGGGVVSSLIFVVPALNSTEARLEVRGRTASGEALVIRQHAPFRIAQLGESNHAVEWVVGTDGYARSDLAVGSTNQPHLALLSNNTFKLQAATRSSGVWNSVIVPDNQHAVHGQVETYARGNYGLGPSIAIDGAGATHLAYHTEFKADIDGQELFGPTRRVLRYRYSTPAGYVVETVDLVESSEEGCALTLDGQGRVYIAFNSGVGDISNGGMGNQYRLRVKHKLAGGGIWAHADGPVGMYPSDIRARAGGDGALWVSYRSEKTGLGYVDRMMNGVLESRLVTAVPISAIAVAVGGDGQPVVAYAALAGTPNQTKVYVQYYMDDGEVWGWTAPVAIDGALGSVPGLDLQYCWGRLLLAYAQNGVIKVAAKLGSGSWTVTAQNGLGSATSPVRVAGTASGAWVTWRDQEANAIRALGLGSAVTGAASPQSDASSRSEGAQRVPVSLTSLNYRAGLLQFELSGDQPFVLDAVLFDVAGRVLARRGRESFASGTRQVAWQPKDVPPGVYFVRALLNEVPAGLLKLAILR